MTETRIQDKSAHMRRQIEAVARRRETLAEEAARQAEARHEYAQKHTAEMTELGHKFSLWVVHNEIEYDFPPVYHIPGFFGKLIGRQTTQVYEGCWYLANNQEVPMQAYLRAIPTSRFDEALLINDQGKFLGEPIIDYSLAQVEEGIARIAAFANVEWQELLAPLPEPPVV